MDEATQADQMADTAEGTAGGTGQTDNQTNSSYDSTGSEAHTNAEGNKRERTMIELPSEKWREANYTIRELKEQLKAYEQTSTSVAGGGDNVSDDTESEAVNTIAEAVYAKIAPSLSTLERAERESVIQDIGNRPYAKDLSQEIARNFTSNELKHLPVRERMERAYEISVGRNVDKIIQATSTSAKDDGYNAAYDKISEKQSATTERGGTSARGNATSPVEQLASGQMTPAEYERKRAEIFNELGLGKPSTY